ncbi:LysR family transcriptional regulator [Pseudaeromonas sharmana]|uniref:LysR family transcriptional regulator n=1 Tax=Pseudaeromonas sharmana TaxID=328412 RepID=A0ABV8CRR8_9GAMM
MFQAHVIYIMNISRYDLNLLVYLDVLLREQSVTRAAAQLGLTQPAMSNGLKRLRDMFADPLLVRTQQGMQPTPRARELQPQIRQLLLTLESTLSPNPGFNPQLSQRHFRIMASDYAASTLIPRLLLRIGTEAPGITLDIMTPSDVTFHEIEDGRVDLALNIFDDLPDSFHQKRIWRDDFVCLLHREHPLLSKWDAEAYLAQEHVWVSKTGYGVGVGIELNELQKLGWVDRALANQGWQRPIRVFTRNYQVAINLALESHLVATIPARAAGLALRMPEAVIRRPPVSIPPIELIMVWSPLLHHDAAHIWLRQAMLDAAATVSSPLPAA